MSTTKKTTKKTNRNVGKSKQQQQASSSSSSSSNGMARKRSKPEYERDRSGEDDAPLSEIEGFKVLRLRPRYMPDGAIKVLFFKAHESKSTERKNLSDDQETEEEEEEGPEGLPVGRTLFVTNPSFYFQEQHFISIFELAGHVERVILGSLQKEGSHPSFLQAGCAHVIFSQAKSVTKALAWTEGDAKKLPCPMPVQTGLAQWVADYRTTIVPAPVLKKRADAFLTQWDQEQAKQRADEAKAAEPDDDGWITVGKKSRKKAGAPKQTPAVAAKAGDLLVKTHKPEAKDRLLDDFYKFQKREKRRKELEQLRRSFEEDKARIARMQGERRFRP